MSCYLYPGSSLCSELMTLTLCYADAPLFSPFPLHHQEDANIIKRDAENNSYVPQLCAVFVNTAPEGQRGKNTEKSN